jgi:hypothetical protein
LYRYSIGEGSGSVRCCHTLPRNVTFNGERNTVKRTKAVASQPPQITGFGVCDSGVGSYLNKGMKLWLFLLYFIKRSID